MKPTVVLVHGAFADSGSWDGVISALRETDLPVVAAANPLRGLAAHAAAVSHPAAVAEQIVEAARLPAAA